MSISVTKDNALTVQVGATATITDELHLDVDDTEYPNSAITYTITSPPSKGTLLKNGVATSSFTQDDIDNDRISYRETTPSSSSTSDGFFFQASDPGGNQTANTFFPISITPAPGTPVSLSAPGMVKAYAGLATGLFKVQVVDATPSQNYTVEISAASGKLSVFFDTGVTSTITLTGSFASVNNSLASLLYIGSASGNDTITMTVTSQADLTSATKRIDVAVRPQGDFVTFDSPLAGQTKAFGINNAGQIAGLYVPPQGEQHGFFYSGGTFTTLDPPSYFNEAAQGINESGVVVGFANAPSGGFSADLRTGFRYSNGTFQFADTGAPSSRVFFEDINNNGAIAGYSTNIPPMQTNAPPQVSTAFVYQNGSYQAFGPQGNVEAYGINDGGQVVGSFNTLPGQGGFPTFGPKHGFLYSNGIFSTFDVPNAGETIARDINNNGEIVGNFGGSDGGEHGFAYNLATGQFTTIDVPGATATFVYGVNDLNQIVGSYTDTAGNIHGFVGNIPPPLPHAPAGNIDEWILFNSRWQASAQPGSHPAGFRVAAVADFTGDGTSDILWQNVSNGVLDLWKMSHGAWAGSVDLGAHPGAGWQLAGTGDFNHDGTSDVFWFNPSSGATDIWLMANGGWFASVDPGSHPLGYQVAGIGDFNHDGTSDVLWFNPTTRDVDEWNIVDGHWAGSNHIGVYPSAGYQVAAIGDFNNDGTDDVVWHNAATGAVDIWLLQNGTWSASRNAGNHATGWTVAGVGDFNPDGTDDLLWYDPTAHGADEWLMADGRVAQGVFLGVHPGSAAIAGVGDFNGSGISDILWHQFV